MSDKSGIKTHLKDCKQCFLLMIMAKASMLLVTDDNLTLMSDKKIPSFHIMPEKLKYQLN